MRKHLVWVVALAFAATSVGIAFADSDNVSTISMKVTPKTLSKTKFKPAGLSIETTTTVNGDPGSATEPTLFPDPTSKVVLKFDDDIKFNPGATPGNCTQEMLDGTDKPTALANCGSDKVGTGSAVACASNGTGGCGLVVPAEVLAFNGGKQGQKATFLLWTNNDLTGETTLPAVLKTGGSGDFGSTLTVTVPALADGAGSLTDFKTTVKKKDYIKARCHDTNKNLDVKATFTYNVPPNGQGGGPDSVSDSSKCST
jgi:hypothetical protein